MLRLKRILKTLSAMNADQVLLESVKLAAQLLGAVAVARLTVKWALSRYKSEKVWERRLVAYAALVTAVSEMRRINEGWMFEEESGRSTTDEYRETQSRRYSDAARKVAEESAIARLLLPASTSTILDKMDSQMAEDTPDMGYYERLDIDGHALHTALEALIVDGRTILAIDQGG